MPAEEVGFEQRLADAVSMPASAQRALYIYWLLANELLKKLAEESAQLRPVDRLASAEDVREWRRKGQEHIDKSESLQIQLRRVESYLGHKPREIDPRVLEDAKNLAAEKWARTWIQNGESAEFVAKYLRNFLSSSLKGKRGRPPGSMNYDRHALDALVRREIDPTIWTWPKLADELLGCNLHLPHTWDSNCTVALKKSVHRLRKFLQEIGFQVSP